MLYNWLIGDSKLVILVNILALEWTDTVNMIYLGSFPVLFGMGSKPHDRVEVDKKMDG